MSFCFQSTSQCSTQPWMLRGSRLLCILSSNAKEGVPYIKAKGCTIVIFSMAGFHFHVDSSGQWDTIWSSQDKERQPSVAFCGKALHEAGFKMLGSFHHLHKMPYSGQSYFDSDSIFVSNLGNIINKVHKKSLDNYKWKDCLLVSVELIKFSFGLGSDWTRVWAVSRVSEVILTPKLMCM